MVIYGSVYMCRKCGFTGSRKLIKLARKCDKPTTRGQGNLDAYAVGKPPAGHKGWPYKRVHLCDNIVVNNVQTQVDRMHKKYKNEYEKKEKYVYEAEDDSAFEEDSQNIEYEPVACSSGSESDSD